MLYDINSIDIYAVATLMGCKPDYGLVNRMNDLRKDGRIKDGMTYGAVVQTVLRSMLETISG